MFVGMLLLLTLSACSPQGLTFPTPGKQDLVVLVAPGMLTYQKELPLIAPQEDYTEPSSADEISARSGLEFELIEAFAQELGVAVHYIETARENIPTRLAVGEAHFAIGWLPHPDLPNVQATSPILRNELVYVQDESALPIRSMQELHKKPVWVLKDNLSSNQLAQLPSPIEFPDFFQLLEALSKNRNAVLAMDSRHALLAAQYFPNLQITLISPQEHPIHWWLGKTHNPELRGRLEEFIQLAHKSELVQQIEDRYLGHVRRLKAADIANFMERLQTRLPALRPHFERAQKITGIDWRLLAALAYQESHWNPFATSRTKVRGLMMLTEETADRMGVMNRLDPGESVLAGARYLNLLKQSLGRGIQEPDRTWLALAAYNVGPNHMAAARSLARLRTRNPGRWYDMKQILPLMAQRQYAKQVKSGRMRGGEAVIMVENIRNYYDLLNRHLPEHGPRRHSPKHAQLTPRFHKSQLTALPPSSHGASGKARHGMARKRSLLTPGP